MSSPIRVSVIIPVYNGATTVARAIDSALAQDFEGQEIIVVNDGSTDDTAQVLVRYGDRIHVIQQSNSGAAAARNAGIATARGEYIAFLDCDDVWLQGHLLKAAAALDANYNAVLSFSKVFFVDSAGNPVRGITFDGSDMTLDKMLSPYDWAIYPSSVLVRRDALINCGGFSTEFRGCGLEDPFLWFVLREQGSFAHVAEPLVMYRTCDFTDMAVKYGPNRRSYLRLLRERYGDASSLFRKNVNRSFAYSYAARAFREMDAGHMAAALSCWAKVAWLRPCFFFENGTFYRFIHPKTAARLSNLIYRSALSWRHRQERLLR